MERPVVHTASGDVLGISSAGATERVHVFRGIPYARPPQGALRFAAPVAPESWQGVRDGRDFGPTAPQAPPAVPMFPVRLSDGDEFLNLNVYTPELGGARLPVLVWIHGGGMVMGSNSDPWTQGDRLARRGIVFVAINYRLGADGFLPLRDATPNRGVQDWVAGLEWVQENIEAFGGDPRHVTVGGHSAGSFAALQLAADNHRRHLFDRVIAMSGVPWNPVDLAAGEAWADEFVSRLGVERTTDGLASVPTERLYALQNELAPVAGIGDLSNPAALFGEVASFRTWLGPLVDGDTVPRAAFAAFASGTFSDGQILIGSTVDETDALLGVLGAGMDAETARQSLAKVGVRSEQIDDWFASLPGRSPAQVLGAALTALSFGVPVVRLAEARAGASADTYVYEFGWQPPTPMGAFHGFDLPYAFDTVNAEGVDILAGGTPPAALADDMAGALVRFVAHGDPGWSAYDLQDRCTKRFGIPSEVLSDPARTARHVFGSIR